MPTPKTATLRLLKSTVDDLKHLEEFYLQGGRAFEESLEEFRNIWKSVTIIRQWAKENVELYIEAANYFVQITNYSKYFLDLEGNPNENLVLYQDSLNFARRYNDQNMEALHLSFIGEVYDAIGESSKAVKYHKQALKIAKILDDTMLKGIALYGLCWSYFYLEKYDKALDYCRQSFAASEKLGIPREISYDLATMGIIYTELGEHEQAISKLNEALVIDKAERDLVAEGATLGSLGEAYIAKGDYEIAEEYTLAAIAIKNLQDIPNLIEHLLDLGEIYLNMGYMFKATGFIDEALELSIKMAQEASQARAYELFSLIYFEIGDKAIAIDHLNIALKLYKNINPKKSKIVRNKLSSWMMST